MDSPVVHWELMSQEMVETGGEGGINAGILKPEREGPWPAKMLFYVAVDDLAPMAG